MERFFCYATGLIIGAILGKLEYRELKRRDKAIEELTDRINKLELDR